LEDRLESEIEIIPSEGLMDMKLVGSSDPEFSAFSKEYDNIGLVVADPEMHICVAENKTLN
jgi:hypothetical protein